jgi:hypothetical protein
VRRGLSLPLDNLGGTVGSERVRGSWDSLELVSAVRTLYVLTLGDEEGRSLGGAAWRAVAVAGTELTEGSSGRVRRTKESTERDFLSLEGERLAVGGIKGP